jgi:hypothetical protein
MVDSERILSKISELRGQTSNDKEFVGFISRLLSSEARYQTLC